MRAYRIMWWNGLESKNENQELDVMIITDSVDKVFDLFRQQFPENDVNLIQNIEIMASTVVVG